MASCTIKPDVCAGCKENIAAGKALEALGKMYHPEHFICETCQKPITDKQFHEKDGKLICMKDYEKTLPVCFQCKKKITGTVVKAMEHTWHDDHFLCGVCKCKLQGKQFMNVKGIPKCEKCYTEMHGKKCKVCCEYVEGEVLVALDADWHPECFKCKKCKKPVTEKTFQVQDGEPIHVTCPPIESFQ